MITFNAEDHTYRLRDVGLVPSVTEILEAMGLTPDYPDKPIYRKRGTAVHKACALLAQGKRVQVDSRIEGYVESYRKFMARTEFVPQLIEQSVWSVQWKVAGTLDLHGSLGGTPTLIDLKSGEPADAAMFQTAAYAVLLKESHNLPTVRRLVLRLDPDGADPRVEEHFGMADDVRMFLSAVSLFHWRSAHRLVKV